MRIVGLLMLIATYVGAWGQVEEARMVMHDTSPGFPKVKAVRQVTQGPKHHFFGYYGIPPWDATGRYLACFESDFSDRLVQPGDVATIGLVDLTTDKFKQVTTTRAWNFQQSSLLHWLGTAPDRKVIYNDLVEDTFTAVILDMFTGEKRFLPRPIAAVAHDGRTAASISFARLRSTRPGYGYAGKTDPWKDDSHPEQDGLYVMDTTTGTVKQIVSIEQVFQLVPVTADYQNAPIWFNHVLFSRDDKRLFFLARYHPKDAPRYTAALTVNLDGTDLRCVLPYEWGASHFDWRDGKSMVVTSQFQAKKNDWKHVFLADGASIASYIAYAPRKLKGDGHCHFSYDGEWMVTDTYPRGKQRMQTLYLMNTKTQQTEPLVSFHEPKQFRGEWRCDLHPRWSRDGKHICVDSTHTGTRQVYIVDLSDNNG